MVYKNEMLRDAKRFSLPSLTDHKRIVMAEEPEEPLAFGGLVSGMLASHL